MSSAVSRVAALAQLTPTAAEAHFLPQELAALKAALDRLPEEAAVPTVGIRPAALRPDDPQPSLPQAAALQNAAAARDGYFTVKR